METDLNPKTDSEFSLPTPTGSVLETDNMVLSNSKPASPIINTESTQTSITQSNSSSINTPIVDNDLIDKEWVERLKKILKQTAGNPYQQSLEVSRLKADFLKTKFNKEIKVN